MFKDKIAKRYEYFWSVVSLCNKDNNYDLNIIIDYLAKKEDKDICKFYIQMHELLEQLDNDICYNTYADVVWKGFEYVSWDGFLYAR